VDRWASIKAARDPTELAQPGTQWSALPSRGELVTIPAGYGNRKARRAAKAKQRRDAWHAFKAGRRDGMSSRMHAAGPDLAGSLKALDAYLDELVEKGRR
jgi:hypothetical protein